VREKTLRLVIANKNYSSWSLRPWLLLRQLGIDFQEEKLSFSDPAFGERVRSYSPAGLVPVLLDGELRVWDSLAIVEHVAERFPDRGVWPAELRARAMARSICAEMHSGFAALREAMPMNVEASLPGRGWSVRVQRDVDRVIDLWRDARALEAAPGPMLFGAFSAADAFYAPVVLRFVTYDVELPADGRTYVAAMLDLPAMKEWVASALDEKEFVAMDEPYRRSHVHTG